MERTEVVIVRHGQTVWNLEGKRQGHLDSPLTENGMAQARALAQRLKRHSFSGLYSSDLGRAVETARIVSAATGHEVITDLRLRERNLGMFQGLAGKEIGERYPEEYRLHRNPDYVIPGGESIRQQMERNVTCLTEIARRHPGERLVVVTHAGVLGAFFRYTLSIPLDAPRRYEFVNAGLSVFAYDDGNWFLQTWGDVSHL